MAGVLRGFQYERAKERLKWPAGVPQGLMTFIGISEIIGAVDLILPAVTGIQPWLTPLAAAGLAVVMLIAIVFHIPRREYSSIVFNLILLALAVFVSYGRFALVS